MLSTLSISDSISFDSGEHYTLFGQRTRLRLDLLGTAIENCLKSLLKGLDVFNKARDLTGYLADKLVGCYQPFGAEEPQGKPFQRRFGLSQLIFRLKAEW